MGYIFKEKITYSDYKQFIKNYEYLSFMQENLWAKTKNLENYKIVGVYENDILVAMTMIIFEGKKNIKAIVQNGYLMDFTNYKLLEFMTKSIKQFVKKYKAYVLEVYPYISNKNPLSAKIHNDLLKLNYIHEEEYFDNTSNVIINIEKNDIDNLFGSKDSYTKKGVFFDITNKIEDLNRFEALHDNNVIPGFLNNLILQYKGRIQIIFAKFDLVFYLEYLKNNNGSEREIKKIDDLIYAVGDEIDIGCSLIMLPANINNNICEFLLDTYLESFENIDIKNGLLLETTNIMREKNIKYLKISNTNLDIMKTVNKYNATAFKYIGRYDLVIKPLKYMFNKERKRG